MKIYVGGINAVGKSSILKEVAIKTGYEYIHATTGLMEYFGFRNDYDKLRALTQKKRDTGLRKYIENILADNNRRNCLVDAHYLNLVRGKIDSVTDSWLKDFDALILISAPLTDIWNRIIMDTKTRDRALFPAGLSDTEMLQILDRYQAQTLMEYERIIKLYKKQKIEIMNKTNKADMATEQLINFITYHSQI